METDEGARVPSPGGEGKGEGGLIQRSSNLSGVHSGSPPKVAIRIIPFFGLIEIESR